MRDKPIYWKIILALIVWEQVVWLFLTPYPALAALDYKGICYGSWLCGEYSSPDSDSSLDKLKNTNANYVGLIGTWYMDAKDSNEIKKDPIKSPSDADVIEAIKDIHERGMSVMLKLHVNVMHPDGSIEWAGKIKPSDPNAWFNSYSDFASYYAQIAHDHDVELLCIGTELTSMTTGNISSDDYSSDWNTVIDNIKSTYKGPLTFCANFWWEYDHLPFWDRMDIAGISAYCDLVDESNPKPTLSEIIDAWYRSWNGHNWVKEIEDWQAIIKKSVIFPEVGYCSVNKAAYKPWDGPRDYPYNGQLQTKCYEAVFRVFKDKDWFKGMFWWIWLPDPKAGSVGDLYHRDYTPQNKPAEAVLKAYYGVGCYIGAYLGCGTEDLSCEKISDFNEKMGKRHAIFLRYVDISDSDNPDHWEWAQEVKASGAVPMFIYDPWAGLNNIDMDKIKSFALSCNDFKVPIFIVFGHEMNGPWYPWGNKPETYKQKFKQVAEIFHQYAKNVYMCWVPNQNWGYPWGGIDYGDGYSEYYPEGSGDYGEYVDWVGLNFYDKDYDENNQVTANFFIDNIKSGQDGINFYETFAVGKNTLMLIAETAAFDPNKDPTGEGERIPLTLEEQASFKNEWISQVYSVDTLRSEFPKLKAICYFHVEKRESIDTQNHHFHDILVDYKIPDTLPYNIYNTLISDGYFLSSISPILPGDANGDESINVQDVICIINVILDIGTASGNPDCNNDGDVNVQDVICVINKILGG